MPLLARAEGEWSGECARQFGSSRVLLIVGSIVVLVMGCSRLQLSPLALNPTGRAPSQTSARGVCGFTPSRRPILTSTRTEMLVFVVNLFDESCFVSGPDGCRPDGTSMFANHHGAVLARWRSPEAIRHPYPLSYLHLPLRLPHSTLQFQSFHL